jgi:hypothetical protein
VLFDGLPRARPEHWLTRHQLAGNLVPGTQGQCRVTCVQLLYRHKDNQATLHTRYLQVSSPSPLPPNCNLDQQLQPLGCALHLRRSTTRIPS